MWGNLSRYIDTHAHLECKNKLVSSVEYAIVPDDKEQCDFYAKTLKSFARNKCRDGEFISKCHREDHPKIC